MPRSGPPDIHERMAMQKYSPMQIGKCTPIPDTNILHNGIHTPTTFIQFIYCIRNQIQWQLCNKLVQKYTRQWIWLLTCPPSTRHPHANSVQGWCFPNIHDVKDQTSQTPTAPTCAPHNTHPKRCFPTQCAWWWSAGERGPPAPSRRDLSGFSVYHQLPDFSAGSR